MKMTDETESSVSFSRYFCRHLVSLSGWYFPVEGEGNKVEQIQSFCYSGFILSIKGMWCLVTAGHIIQDLEEHIQQKKINIVRYTLTDYFGPEVVSREPIPFDYEKAPKGYIFDGEKGLDFGIIGLSLYYQQLMRANGIVPVAEENWKKQGNVEFGHHIMLGLPEKLIEKKIIMKKDKIQLLNTMRPVVLNITKLEKQPATVENTEYPRFVGKIDDDVIDDITGMSGGPIIGFGTDNKRYWIVAVQSSWLKDQKIIFGCPVPIFAGIVEKIFEDISDNINE
jgi:hypothetical protein